MTVALFAALIASGQVASMSDQQLDAKIAQAHQMPSFPDRIEAISRLFLGVPYQELPLGDGPGSPEPGARWNLRGVDCQTYVETVMAMANARSLDEAKNILDDIRYMGPPNFVNRNHFTEAQWIPANTQKGYITDEVPTIDGRAPTETLTLVKAQWSKIPTLRRLADAGVPDGKFMVRYLPMDELRKHVKSIQPGTILMVVRQGAPDKVVRISHMGFVLKGPEGWVVRHATTGKQHAVIDEPFGEFVAKQNDYKKWPVAGFAMMLPVDDSLRVSQIQKAAAN
jgi:hypothetical protein